MQRLVVKASAFTAASYRAVLAWALPRARLLKSKIDALPPRALPLGVAAGVLLLTLFALAIPESDERAMLASVELKLGPGGSAQGADEIAIKLPIAPGATTTLADGAPAPENDVATADEPNLEGLAEIPEELIAKQGDKPNKRGAPKQSFAAFDQARETLPWKAAEPVIFKPMGPGEQHKPGTPAPAAAPQAAPTTTALTGAEIAKWTKGKATKIMGADRKKPLYHFAVWIEPPAALQDHLAGVSYDFSSPAVQPQSQASMDKGSGFKINAAGLACADEIVVTLRFDDGRVEKISVDGCELFNKA